MPQDGSADAQLKVRVDRKLREKLERIAEQRGVSLNREIADRIARSLEEEDRQAEFDATSPAHGIWRVAAAAMDAAGKSTMFVKTRSTDHPNWVDDESAYANAVSNAIEVLNALKPRPGKQSASSKAPPPSHFDDGVYCAEIMLQKVAAVEDASLEPKFYGLRQGLGDLVGRINHFATIDPDERALVRLRKRIRK